MSQTSVMDLRFNGKYQILEATGGNTYLGVNTVTQEDVQIKLEPVDQSILKHEAQVYRDMTGAVGFSFIHWFGTEGEYNVLVTSLLGPTLESLFQICEGKLSLKTILLLHPQVMNRLEDLHAEGYVHGRITPENLHMGQGKFGIQVNVANLGYARRYMVQDSHVPYPQRNSTNATDRYSSINAHKGIVESCLDDILSWYYVMGGLCSGSLPWEGYTLSELVLEKKADTTPEELFHGYPPEFASSMRYVQSLQSGEKPDYEYLRAIFRGLFSQLSFNEDYYFDWMTYKHCPDRTKRTKCIVQYGKDGLLAQFKPLDATAQQMKDWVNDILNDLSKAEETCGKLHEELPLKPTLRDEEAQALIAAHRNILDWCCDFIFAIWHSPSSEPLRPLASTDKVLDRMWHNGINSLVELRRRLPVHHSLAFLRLAYSMVGLIKECAPGNKKALWEEILGDLARCIWGIIEDADDDKRWLGVASTWYNKAADECPDDGRLQHHLGVAAGSEIAKKLFHYSRALLSVTPFPITWSSLMLLFERFPEGSELTGQRYPLLQSTLVKAHGVLFNLGSISEYESLMAQFRSGLHNHAGHLREEFSKQSSEIAFILCAAACDFGGNPAYSHQKSHVEDARETRQLDTMLASTFTDVSYVVLHARQTLGGMVSVVCADGERVLPFMHVVLVYLHGLASAPITASHVGRYMPWGEIAWFVNGLSKYVVAESKSKAMEFPRRNDAGRQLPEDFFLRGSTLALNYFPPRFFDVLNPNIKERMEERPEYVVYRAERIWYLAHGLALVSQNLGYDPMKQEFSGRR